MKRYIIMLLAAFVLLSFSGCGWMEGEYVYEETYCSEDTNSQKDAISVSSYMQMRNALVNLIERGAKSGIFDVSGFSGGSVRFFMDASIRYVTNSNAMGYEQTPWLLSKRFSVFTY